MLAKFENDFDVQSSQLGFLSQVSTSKDIREASKDHEKLTGEFMTDLWMREDLYNVVKEYKKIADETGTFKKLDHESQRYVEKMLEDFETGGMKLAPEQRQHLVALQKEIADLESKAEANINEDKTKMELFENQLTGLPKDVLDKLPVKQGANGTRIIPLHEKTVLAPMMKLIQNEETRKQLDFAHSNINKDNNVPIIDKLVQLRQEEALILGYSSYSEMVLEGRMAKNPATVQNFEDGLIQKLSQQSVIEK